MALYIESIDVIFLFLSDPSSFRQTCLECKYNLVNFRIVKYVLTYLLLT